MIPKAAKPTVAAIILAAGSSTRLGLPKQTLQIGEESFISRITRKTLTSSCFPVVVVLGFQSDHFHKEVENLPVYIEQNEHWERGISTSIKCGVECALKSYPLSSAFLFICVDQPFLEPLLLNQMIDELKRGKHRIVACKSEDLITTPILIDGSLLGEINELKGDYELPQIIENLQSSKITYLEFPMGSFNIDTPEQYMELENRLASLEQQ